MELQVSVAAKRIHTPDGRTYDDRLLAEAVRLMLTADVAGMSEQNRDRLALGERAAGYAMSPAAADTGVFGRRYELALLHALTSRPSSAFARYLRSAFLIASRADSVGESVDSGPIQAVGLAREKAGTVELVAQSAEQVAAVLHDDAKIVLPGHTGAWTKLLPGGSGYERLDQLLGTPMTRALTGFPQSTDQLHHADLLVGTADGRYWLAADVKTSRTDRPPTRRAWRGIGLHIDILLTGESEAYVEDLPVPRVTLHTGHDGFSYMVRAQRILAHLHNAPRDERPHGDSADDRIIRELLDLRWGRFDALQHRLQELSDGARLLVATDRDVAAYGTAQPDARTYGHLHAA